MTPAQSYSQWRRWNKDPTRPESSSVRRYSQQFQLEEDEEQDLLGRYPDAPYAEPKKSGFLEQTLGAGVDELQKSFGSAIAGPGAKIVSDWGWEGGAKALEDIGTDIVQQQEEDLSQYAAPQTRDELIAEGGFMGAVYEHALPEETQTPEQFGRQAAVSLGAAGIALGAAGVAYLTAPVVLPAAVAAGVAGKALFVGGTAMVVGNLAGSFQVGGEEFETAKRDPFIREQLGIGPDVDFADLEPTQQRALNDSAQRVAKDTMVERLYTSGALESLAFIPYGTLALRYVADIALGATSEELDKRLGMENTIQELQRLGVSREEVPELRERIKGLRPGTFETVWNAAIMEATFGAPTALIETAFKRDDRIDPYLTDKNLKQKELEEKVKEAAGDPEKLKQAAKELRAEKRAREKHQLSQARAQQSMASNQQSMDQSAESHAQNMDSRAQSMEAKEQERLAKEEQRDADRIQSELDTRRKKGQEGSIQDATNFSYAEELETGAGAGINQATDTDGKLKGSRAETSSSSRDARGEQTPDMPNIDTDTVSTDGGVVNDERLVSFDRIMHRAALNELNKAFPAINFQAAHLVTNNQTGELTLLYDDGDGKRRKETNVRGDEGFVIDTESDTANPQVYLTQSMFDEDARLITDNDKALDRLVQVAFHESVGHLGLRKALNAGTFDPETKTWSGEEYNKFITDFDNRHSKMVDKWVEGAGSPYATKDRFRQVEEFIASNFGEVGGGKDLGFFDNIAIAIREANPFIQNSLNQWQVATTIQSVVNQNLKGIKGKPKKNLLTGAEFAGTITRAAAGADLDVEVMGEAEVKLREKPLKLGTTLTKAQAIEVEERQKQAALEAENIAAGTEAGRRRQQATEERAAADKMKADKAEKKFNARKKTRLENLNKKFNASHTGYKADSTPEENGAVLGRALVEARMTHGYQELNNAEFRREFITPLIKDVEGPVRAAAAEYIKTKKHRGVLNKLAGTEVPDLLLEGYKPKKKAAAKAGPVKKRVPTRAEIAKEFEKRGPGNKGLDMARQRARAVGGHAWVSRSNRGGIRDGVYVDAGDASQTIPVKFSRTGAFPFSWRNRKSFHEQRPETAQLGPAVQTYKKEGESDAQTQARHTRTVNKAFDHAAKEIEKRLGSGWLKNRLRILAKARQAKSIATKAEEKAAIATGDKKTVLTKLAKKRREEADAAMASIPPLTEDFKRGDPLVKERVRKGKKVDDVVKAEKWEMDPMLIELPKEEDKALIPKMRTDALYYEVRRILSQDQLSDMEYQQNVADQSRDEISTLLGLADDENITQDKIDKASPKIKKRVLKLKKIAQDADRHDLESQRILSDDVSNALEGLEPEALDAILMDIGVHHEKGYGGKQSKEEIGKKLGVSRTQVGRLLTDAYNQLFTSEIATRAQREGYQMIPKGKRKTKAQTALSEAAQKRENQAREEAVKTGEQVAYSDASNKLDDIKARFTPGIPLNDQVKTDLRWLFDNLGIIPNHIKGLLRSKKEAVSVYGKKVADNEWQWTKDNKWPRPLDTRKAVVAENWKTLEQEYSEFLKLQRDFKSKKKGSSKEALISKIQESSLTAADRKTKRLIEARKLEAKNKAEVEALVAKSEKQTAAEPRGAPTRQSDIDSAPGALSGNFSFSRRAIPLEVQMRKTQIDRLPKGSLERLAALQSLKRIYQLNPVGEKFPSNYEIELKGRDPVMSWSRRGMPLTEKAANRLLTRGNIFFNPQLIREIMGKRPKHINTVMSFMKKQRQRLLAGDMGVRDVAKAYLLTVTSQGMSGTSPWTIWGATGGVRRLSPTNKTLEKHVETLNLQEGRDPVTIEQIVEWYNKAPLWDKPYTWEVTGKTHPMVESWDKSGYTGTSKPQIIKDKAGRYVLNVDGRNQPLVGTPLWLRDPGSETAPNEKTGALWISDEYTDDRGFVRAEDGIAWWMATKDGQKALDEIEGGTFNPSTWRTALDIRLSMGDDRGGRAMLEDLNEAKKQDIERGKGKADSKAWNPKTNEWLMYNFSNMGAFATEMNKIVKEHTNRYTPLTQESKKRAAEAIANDMVTLTKKLKSIAVGKEGFIKHMLGMGNSPTIDAIELNVWLAGHPNKAALMSPLTWGDTAWQKVKGSTNVELINHFSKMSGNLVPGMKNMTYMDLMKKRIKGQFDRIRAADPKAFADIDQDLFYHTMHHWLWDRAKGITANTNMTDISSGKVGESFRPGVYQAMVKETEGVKLTERDVTWKGEDSGALGGQGTFSKDLLNQLSRSRRGARATPYKKDGFTTYLFGHKLLPKALIEKLDGKKFTRIQTDRFATGVYKPLSNDPNHPFNQNPFYMQGGVGFTLIPGNQQAGVMWASDSTTINQDLVNQVNKQGVTHGMIYLMTPDSHLSNKAVWKIYATETDWMLSQGEISQSGLEARIQVILDSKSAVWDDSKNRQGEVTAPGIRTLLQEGTGNTNWDKLKSIIKGTTFSQRKKIITWLGGDVISKGTVKETKAGLKKGFFAGTWDSDMNVNMTKNPASYGAPLSMIYPRITQSPHADNFSVIGISEFHKAYKDPATGKMIPTSSDLEAKDFGVPEHEAYRYLVPGAPVAYFGEANGGVDANEAFETWLPKRKTEAARQLSNFSAQMNLDNKLIDELMEEGAEGKVKDKVNQKYKHKSWEKLEKQIYKGAQKLGRTKEQRQNDVNTAAAALNALRATEVTQIMRGFSMSSIPITPGPDVLSKFSQPGPVVNKTFISRSRRASMSSRSQHAANSTGPWGRWTALVRRAIRKVEPLSKIADRARYLSERQVAFGQMARWEKFGKSVYDALINSKQSKEVYKYLTTPNTSSSIIRDPAERAAAEKAKMAVKQIGDALVKRKLLKQKTLDQFKKKYGDYLPRVYLQHLLSEENRTQIAQGLKPTNLGYLKERRDIPKGVRELLMGEIKDQPGAPAYLASRATMIPGKDIAVLDWISRMKDISIKEGLNWVLPAQFVTYNVLDEAKKIAGSVRGGAQMIRELQMDVDLSGLSAEVTPEWLAAEGDKLTEIAEALPKVSRRDKAKQTIIQKLGLAMISEAKAKEKLLDGVDKGTYKRIPSSSRYGAIRGMYVHKQIADDIMGGMKLATGDESTMEKIFGDTGMMGRYNAYWKWAKVAANPPSWARNYLSNNILLTLAGVPFWSVPGLNVAAIKEMRTKGRYYQIAIDQGIVSSTMSSAELNKMEHEFVDVMRKMKGDKSPLAWMGSTMSKLVDKTSNIYGGIEVISKIAAIKYAMEKKGMNESQAAAFANKWLFDYGLVTPSVRYASTAVVGAPFIRFQSKAIPLMFEVMLTRPWRLAPYYAVGYGMAELFKQKHDIDEDELDAMKMSLAEWLREKAINGILPPNVIPLPALDDQGRWQIYDASYIMPWGMLSEMATELQQGNVLDAMKTFGLMGGPLPDMLAVLKTGVDPFTRQPITDTELKTPTEQAFDYLTYIMNLSMPSMLHSKTGAVFRFLDAATGELDPKTGEPKYTLSQAAMRLAGTNIYPTNLVEQRKANLRRMQWQIGNMKSDWTRRVRGMRKSGASQEEIKEAREEYRERLTKKLEERRDYMKKSVVPESLKAG